MAQQKKHVVIVGAGISGLAAAHELSKHHSSIQVTVLEARNRIGGRLDTHRKLFEGDHGDIPIDFGASWIHGVDPSNPLVALAEASNARLEATNSDVIFVRPGQPALQQEESNHYWAVLWDIFARAQAFSRANRSRISIHTSFRQWLDHHLATRQCKNESLPNYMSSKELKIIPLLAQFWADENAISLDKVSLKYMDAEDMPPGDHCIMVDGYDRVLDELCKDMKSVPIHLEHVVDRIEYNESSVRISTNKGSFTADVVLVTLPLGVLKSNSVAFSPPLPERKQTAINRLGFGTMVKIVLYFPTCFWPEDKHFINFLPIPNSIPNPKLCRHLNRRQMAALKTYMSDLANYTSLMPIHGAPVLIAYAANASAEVFGKLSEQEAMEVLVCQLSHYFDVLVKDPTATKPTRTFMTRWHSDPYARGSYTSIPVGAHQSDLGEFEIPVGALTVIVQASNEQELVTKEANASARGKRKPISNGHGPRHPHEMKVPNGRGSLALNLTTATTHHLANYADSSISRGHGHFGSMNKVGNGYAFLGGVHGVRARNNDVQAVKAPPHGPTSMSADGIVGLALGGMVTHVAPELLYKDAAVRGPLEQAGSVLSEVDPLILSRKENSKMQDSGPAPKKPATFVRTIAVDDNARGRIHFAGEHTTPTSFASVHGALMTGRREAAKIIAQTF
ncbi:hypothetical protein BGZ67_006069 [Mortierella alpina]|nr:hypothetical protein BGZ67_006069 [Mortierella alpina]